MVLKDIRSGLNRLPVPGKPEPKEEGGQALNRRRENAKTGFGNWHWGFAFWHMVSHIVFARQPTHIPAMR